MATAGVALNLDALGAEALPVAVGIMAGLLVGKPVGLFGAIWLSARPGIASLLHGIGWRRALGWSCPGGMGFTKSLFVATLAFGSSRLLETAKRAILSASLVAGVVGFAILRSAGGTTDTGSAEIGRKVEQGA
jgi:Na+:H+ antiporter, NhaA family